MHDMHTVMICTLSLFFAAVSDFYTPSRDMAQHKIQSSGGELKLVLHPVPKVFLFFFGLLLLLFVRLMMIILID